MSDVIVVTRLSQFGLGAGSLLKFVGELRGKGCHLVALNDGIDTTDRAGWSFFQHCAALVSAEKKFARERADVEYLVVGRSRGRRGGPRRKKLLTEEQFLEAQRVVLARSHTTTMAEVARSLGISRATLYRRKVHERPTDWSKVYPELAS
jgi:DNA invertase Pin-like site-specific DNA recombinase